MGQTDEMLSSLDQSLEDFLRSEVPLRPEDVDVVFATPDKEWSGRVTRSTVNLFMFDVRRSVNRSVTAMTTKESNGSFSRSRLAPLIKVRYLVTVWTKEAGDEHRVLGDLLSLIALSTEIPNQFLIGDLEGLGYPAQLMLGLEDGRPTNDMWGPLGVPPRASLELAVVLPARRPLDRNVPAPPEDVSLGVSDQNEPTRTSYRRRVGGMIEDPAAKGARIIGPRGSSIVEEDGHYLVSGEPGDDLVVETEPPIHVVAGPANE